MRSLAFLAAWALAACAAPAPFTPPPDHPASPRAAEGAPPPPFIAFADFEAPHVQPAAAGEYVCPMHEEVTSDVPGECPKCGMDLKRRAPAGER